MIDQLAARLRAQSDVRAILDTILYDVVALHGAEFGDVQLAVNDTRLVIVGQRGFGHTFLNRFHVVDKHGPSSCARAFHTRTPVIVTDVTTDPSYEALRAAARETGFRSRQSTPLIASDTTLVGVISTHFANTHEPTSIEMQTLSIYSRLAADSIQEKLGAARASEQQAEALFQSLLLQTAVV